jgi:hypothetical protein
VHGTTRFVRGCDCIVGLPLLAGSSGCRENQGPPVVDYDGIVRLEVWVTTADSSRLSGRLVPSCETSMSLGFSAAGIGLDVDPFPSLAHLSRFGAPSVAPQLIVLRRTAIRDTSLSPVRLLVAESLIVQVGGLDAIRRWVRRGCPLPLLAQAQEIPSDAAEDTRR